MSAELEQSGVWGKRFLCLLGCAAFCGMAVQAADRPFVAGFERFGRHAEIAPTTAGRLLLSELSCTACHTAGSNVEPKRGPNLNGAGNRVSRQWLSEFLAEPQKMKPGTTMPQVLHDLSEADQQETIAALVAFLATQQKPFPEIKGTGARPVPLEFWNRGQVDRGRQLYHRIGCVACHEADASYETVETKPSSLDQVLEQLDPEELKELGLSSAARRVESVPHGNLAAKYSRQSLTFFLLDPHVVRPGGRMPNFKLTVDEASDLTAWLLKDQPDAGANAPQQPPDTVAELAQKGARLFQSLGCANCHAVGDLKPGLTAKPLSELRVAASKSCMGEPSKGLPHFPFDDQQKAAITAALVAGANIKDEEEADPQEHVQFLMLKLNCVACHERDKLGGVGRYRRAYFETYGHIDIGDEGRLPPPLTSVGSKLQPGWMAKVLQGTGVVRPHMRIRMPVFPPELMKPLPQRLASADFGPGNKQPTEKEVFGEQTRLAEAGRRLLDTGCVQCHPLRTEALPGVVGIDLAGTADRIQPRWFHDFLLNPAELKPRTRMPSFFPGGKSQNPDVLGGHSDRQIAAMWAYLKDIDRQSLPAKIELARSQNYELIPKERPILLRTFMDEAGTHAIAVGYPDKVHFAWDAEGIHPAFAWKGRFLDARGTWFERFTPPANPLGTAGISLPRGVAFAVPDGRDAAWPVPTAADEYRYLGHRLDTSGVPTFRYRLRSLLIEERITPTEKGLLRELMITDSSGDQPQALQFMVQKGKELQRDGDRCTNDEGLTVIVPSEFAGRGRIVEREGFSEWLLPVTVDRTQKIEVRYQW